ncbi:MAG: ThiF family adenylyltransferase [Emergencia sp.]|nr:tRNA threonylcarbamoyladenosine dehydratase [Emergencia sp.]
MSRLERTELLIGKENLDRLNRAKVLVFGVGGVGGYVCEALARTGVGRIGLVDNDVISETNLNRQIIATVDTIGRAKTQVMKERILSVNPDCQVIEYPYFYLPGDEEVTSRFSFETYDYVVDAIDTVSAKLDIITRCKAAGTPVISSMGTGNKLDPGRFEITDISKTSVCPLAKVIRKELRDRKITGVKVLYSKEEPIKHGSRTPGSISFVPPAAGLLIAAEVVKDLMEK